MTALRCARKFYVLACLLSPLAGCSNGRGSLDGPETPAAQAGFTIGVTVSGLAGSGLVLQNNAGNDLAVSTNGSAAFSTSLADGAAYEVTVSSQPTSPAQTCRVANGSGRVAGANVTNVTVSCVTGATESFFVSGTVTGLTGAGLVLRNNGGDDLRISSAGTFDFPTLIATGTAYNVTVATQPAGQSCTVANGAGTMGDADVTNVTVTCATGAFSVGGTVNGLSSSGLVLQKNGADDLAIASNGSFTFATAQASGTQYSVTIKTQPANPSQTCTVGGGTGTVASSNVRSVRVDCATNTFSIGGSVSGLLGQKLTLSNSGGDTLEVQSDGAFRFAQNMASGGAYNVTVVTQPSDPTQACTVANGTGTVAGANVTNVAVSCTTSEFMVGGRVRGLAGSGLVLRNNGADDLAVNSDGNFQFATAIPSGATYSVTVAAQPANPTQNCTLSNASGTVGGGNVTSIEVECVTVGFSVGGSVSGLSGAGLVLQNNGDDNLPIAANGAFTFPTSLTSGTPFNVTVASQPTNPSQTCSVTNSAGTVTSGNVTSVTVSCVTNTFTVGGTVTGLHSFGLILQNNGGDSLNIAGDGTFTFPTPLPSGTTYSVTVAASPIFPPQTCSVTSGTGTVGASNVTDVLVSCN